MKIRKETIDDILVCLVAFNILGLVQNDAEAYCILVILSALQVHIITFGANVYLDKELYARDEKAKNGEIPKRIFGSFMCVVGQTCCFKLIEMTINIFRNFEDIKFRNECTNGLDPLALKMSLITIGLVEIYFIIKYIIIYIGLFSGLLKKIFH